MSVPLSDMQTSLLSGCLAWFAVCQTRGHAYCSTFGSTLISTLCSTITLILAPSFFSLSSEQRFEMMPPEIS